MKTKISEALVPTRSKDNITSSSSSTDCVEVSLKGLDDYCWCPPFRDWIIYLFRFIVGVSPHRTKQEQRSQEESEWMTLLSSTTKTKVSTGCSKDNKRINNNRVIQGVSKPSAHFWDTQTEVSKRENRDILVSETKCTQTETKTNRDRDN